MQGFHAQVMATPAAAPVMERVELPEGWDGAPPQEKAEFCVKYMRARRIDYTLLWYLQLWDTAMECTGLHALFVMLASFRISRAEAMSPAFQRRVTDEFERLGVRPIVPDSGVYSFRKDPCKAKAKQAVEDGRWPRIHHPVMFQMRPGLFMMFPGWQDALIAVRELACKRFVEVVPSSAEDLAELEGTQRCYLTKLLYENQLGAGHLTRLIMDCDCKPGEFPQFTRKELECMIEAIPRKFGQLLFKEGLVKKGTIRCHFKLKSRPDKVSCHVITNIVGTSTQDLAGLFSVLFKRPFEPYRRTFVEVTKNWAHVPKDGFPFQLFADFATMGGNHQFSTLFVGKKGQDGKPDETPPTVTKVVEISDGGKSVVEKDTPWRHDEDSNLPTSTHALEHLQGACIGAILPEMISVTVPDNFSYDPPLAQVAGKHKRETKTDDMVDGPLRKLAKPKSPLDGPLKNKVCFIACMTGLP